MSNPNPLPNETTAGGSLQRHDNVVRPFAENLRNQPRNKPLDPKIGAEHFAKLAQYDKSATELAQELAAEFNKISPQPPLSWLKANPILLIPLGIIGVAICIGVIAISLIAVPLLFPPSNPPPTQTSAEPTLATETAPTQSVPPTSAPQRTDESKPSTPLPAAKPNLGVTLVKPLLDTVSPNADLEFKFDVVNNGQIPAQNLVIHTEIPVGTTFIEAEDGVGEKDRAVEWGIGNLNPGETRSRKFKVRVNADYKDDQPITLADYFVRDDSGNEYKGNTVTIQVAVEPRKEFRFGNAAIIPNSVPANGYWQAKISVAVLDQQNIPAGQPVPVEFQVLQPDLGKVEPAQVNSANGLATTYFTAGAISGPVQIKARIGNVEQSLSLLVNQGVPLKNGTTLLNKPPFVQANFIINTLPSTIPLEILTPPENSDPAFTKVALLVWIKRDFIKQDPTTGQWKIVSGFKNERALPGQNPDLNDSLNTPQGSGFLNLESGAVDQIVMIMDDTSNPNFVRVRIEGWMKTEKVK